jgi:hypothetical protein
MSSEILYVAATVLGLVMYLGIRYGLKAAGVIARSLEAKGLDWLSFVFFVGVLISLYYIVSAGAAILKARTLSDSGEYRRVAIYGFLSGICLLPLVWRTWGVIRKKINR